MAGTLTNEGKDLALSLLLNIDTPSIPTTIYQGLLTATADNADTLSTITECTDATYTREAVTFTTPADSSGDRETHNDADIEFGAFTTGGTEIVGTFLTDASSGTTGTLIAIENLATSKYTNAGEVLTVPATTGVIIKLQDPA